MNTPLCLARVLMLLVCIAAPVVSTFAQAPVEPSWKGKYLSHYVGELKNPNPIQRQLAAEAIGNMGSLASPAVPPLVKLLESKEASDRVAAAFALAKIGEGAKAALPQLQKLALSNEAVEKEVAQQAIAAIDPPAIAVVNEFFSSVYVLSLLIAVLAGGIVAVVLWRRNAAKRKKKSAQAVAVAAGQTPAASTDESKARTPQPETADRPAAAPAVLPPASPSASAYRKSISRPLPGMASYVHEQEGPESVKRVLGREQEEFKRLCDKQQELSKLFTSEELNKDPDRVRKLRLEIDELALQHFRKEVRVRALEVKMLEMLVDQGSASDPALRERTEATIKQKWDDLRTLCETPAKTSWKGEGWVSVATQSHKHIDDLRAHLASFDVEIGERSTTPFEAPDEVGFELPSELEPPVSVDDSAAIPGEPPASAK